MDFSRAQIDSVKARKRELPTLEESRRAVGMLNPMRDKKLRHVPGGGERTAPETTVCPEA